jgi:transcriptional regulator PpsR
MYRPVDQPLDLSPLAALAPELAATIASVTRDIALVVDKDGVIRFLAQGPGAAIAAVESWEGRPWIDTVASPSRRKIEQLLQEARERGLSGRREVNLAAADGLEIPVAYSTIRLGDDGTVLAVGRDLRDVAQMQQRFVQAQTDMEREYWQQRQGESRYRRLFEVATDAVFVVDAVTLAIVEANAAAVRLYDLAPDQLLGKRATVGLDRSARSSVEEVLSAVAATGRARETQARVMGKRTRVRLGATPFSADGKVLLLLRAASIGDDEESGAAALARWSALVERTADSIVVCDAQGRIEFVNPAFLRLAGCATDAEVRGEPLARWFAPSFGSLAHVFEQVRRHGLLSAGRGCFVDTNAAAEVSVMLLPGEERHAFGLVLRAIDAAHPAVLTAKLTSAIAQVGAQLGLAPLPTLMQEVAQLAERHLLQSALERSHGEVAAAAGLLDLSIGDFRQRLRAQRLLDEER